jgi:hypothetical protein
MSIRENAYNVEIVQKAKPGDFGGDRFVECEIYLVFNKLKPPKIGFCVTSVINKKGLFNMAKINLKITTLLFYCFILVFVACCAYAVNVARIMHSAQTMVNNAFSQHERITTDRYTKPLITIVKHPQPYTQKGKKKSVKIQP